MNGTNCEMIVLNVNGYSINMFKNRIDRYLIRMDYIQMMTLLDSR